MRGSNKYWNKVKRVKGKEDRKTENVVKSFAKACCTTVLKGFQCLTKLSYNH